MLQVYFSINTLNSSDPLMHPVHFFLQCLLCVNMANNWPCCSQLPETAESYMTRSKYISKGIYIAQLTKVSLRPGSNIKGSNYTSIECVKLMADFLYCTCIFVFLLTMLL